MEMGNLKVYKKKLDKSNNDCGDFADSNNFGQLEAFVCISLINMSLPPSSGQYDADIQDEQSI